MPTDLYEIIERCKTKDHKAFEILYKRYYRVLFGIALRYSRSHAEAEDILQDSFIKIFNSIESYRMKGSFEGWIKRIVQNTAINSYRSHLKFNLHVELSDKAEEIGDDSLASIFDSLTDKDLVAALNQLPEGYRIVLNLYCIDGYSHREIADMLGITEGTSKSQLSKGKTYLKDLIKIQSEQAV